MNVIGLGIDSVDVKRIAAACRDKKKKFLKKIFTDDELRHAAGKRNKKVYFMHLAGKFAAKEAVKKALPDGADIGMAWYDIEILNDKRGKPYVRLHGGAEKIMKKFKLTRVLVSISHTDDIAVSNAVVIKNGD
ncbi:MAG TPA: holo-ACP synthase [Candidatus Omnitrophota bacterium]|nr:holo-ACP synthase [Candidatus Omnitrophota bacterium]HPS21130.1 holo-ACP synthase [Candidatus Omnitrophota bacterium]